MPKLTCKICAESYDNETHRPLVMPCSRTVCRACVLKWAQRPSQKCYGCFGYHEGVNKNNVDTLNVNYNFLEVSLPPPSSTASRTRREQVMGNDNSTPTQSEEPATVNSPPTPPPAAKPAMQTATCRVCEEDYDTGDRKPLFLPCGRNLCRACVRKWLQTPGKPCYVCHDQHDGVKEGDLKTNYDPLDRRPPPADINPGSSTSKDTIALIIKDVRGQVYRLQVPSSSTIGQIKDAIKKEYNLIPVRLLFGGRPRKDTETLTSCGIKTGNALVMTTRFIGGCGLMSVVSDAFGCQNDYFPRPQRSVGFS